MKTCLLAVFVTGIMFYGLGLYVGMDMGEKNARMKANRCILEWWNDSDGIVESTKWSREDALTNSYSQVMYLKEICE